MKKWKTILSTAVAVVAMGASVLAAATPEFKNLSFVGKDDWSAGPYQFEQEKKHTMTTAFQYVKYKGTMTLQITKKVVGMHFSEAETDVYVTNKYGGVQIPFTIDGKVKKDRDRYYRIITKTADNSEKPVEIKITNYKDNVKAK